MIEPTAIIATRWDNKKRTTIPNLVIIISDGKVDAIGESGTTMESYAETLSKKYDNLTDKEMSEVHDDLIESFERTSHGHGYGGTSEIVKYVGTEKARVDKIKDRLITSKVEKKIS